MSPMRFEPAFPGSCFLAAACGDAGSEDRDEWMGEMCQMDVEEYRRLRT